MPRYFFDLLGDQADDTGVFFEDVSEARNAAVKFLGAYLSEHPEYADQGHWQVDVVDEARTPLLHVIVATVDASVPRSQNSSHPHPIESSSSSRRH